MKTGRIPDLSGKYNATSYVLANYERLFAFVLCLRSRIV